MNNDSIIDEVIKEEFEESKEKRGGARKGAGRPKKNKEVDNVKEIDLQGATRNEENLTEPQHYKLFEDLGVKSIDIVKAVVSEYSGEQAFFIGNVLKYIFRAKKKNGIEDIRKAKVYIEWLIQEMEKE